MLAGGTFRTINGQVCPKGSMMAIRIFAGDAVAVAQVDTVQVTAFDAATTYILTINGKTVSVVGVTNVAATTAALEVAWNASTIPEFAEVTALDDDTDTITLTADTEGVPFTVVSSVSGGTGTIGAVASDTVNDGPNVWSADNFKTNGVRGTLPGADDTVILQDSNVSLLYNLDQSAAGTMTELQSFASYTGIIGLDKTNDDGDAYDEYRQRYLALDVGSVRIGDGDGVGSGKIRLQFEAGVASFVSASEASSNDEFGAVEVFGNNQTITVATVSEGTVDFARDNGAAGSTITTLNVDNDAVVRVDENSSVVTVIAGGGELNIENGITTLTLRDDATVTHTVGNIATANVFGGTLNISNDATLTVTNAIIGTGGTIDTTNANATVTITNTTIDVPGTIEDPSKQIEFSTAVDIGNALISEVPLNLGRGRTWLPGN